MRVTIHYLAQVKRLLGVGSETMEVEDGTGLNGLLEQLANRHGTALRSLVFGADGARRPSLLVFVNDEQAESSRVLQDGDEITLLTPMAGG